MSVDQIPQIIQMAGPLSRAFFTGLRHRGRLALLESGEASDHLGVTLGATAAFFGLALMTLFTATIAVAALVWDLPDRASILAGLALGYLAGAAMLGWWLRRRLRNWRPLEASRQQLGADCDWFENGVPAHLGE